MREGEQIVRDMRLRSRLVKLGIALDDVPDKGIATREGLDLLTAIDKLDVMDARGIQMQARALIVHVRLLIARVSPDMARELSSVATQLEGIAYRPEPAEEGGGS